MTLEQNERWKKAIQPLDYLDFHALSHTGLQETAQRLASWGAPGWAIQLRESLVAMSLAPLKPLERRNEIVLEGWHPTFGLRSEVALLGIQIFHPDAQKRQDIYSRVLARFALEAIHPFIEYAQRSSPVLQEGYKPIAELSVFFAWFLAPPPKDFPDVPHFPQEPMDESSREKVEIYWARYMGNHLLKEACTILGFRGEAVPHAWTNTRKDSIDHAIIYLNRQHQWRMGGAENNKYLANFTEPIADAFLTALEAECPPPDWLPRV